VQHRNSEACRHCPLLQHAHPPGLSHVPAAHPEPRRRPRGANRPAKHSSWRPPAHLAAKPITQRHLTTCWPTASQCLRCDSRAADHVHSGRRALALRRRSQARTARTHAHTATETK
jgi:hypothetical protein